MYLLSLFNAHIYLFSSVLGIALRRYNTHAHINVWLFLGLCWCWHLLLTAEKLAIPAAQYHDKAWQCHCVPWTDSPSNPGPFAYI